MRIRAERPEDFDSIDAVLSASMGDHIAKLVREIRASDYYVRELSMLASDDSGCIGYVMLSYIDLIGEQSRRILCLGPLAVRPDLQKQGIGIALTQAALKVADDMGEPVVVLTGHPSYYPRFGFGSARALGILPDNDAMPDEVFMAKALTSHSSEVAGRIAYHPAWEAAEAAAAP